MNRSREFGCAVVLGLAATLAGTAVPGSVRATYPEIMGCESGCEVAAAGWPVPFLVDYPGLSPVHSADLSGAVLGMDRVRWGDAVASFAAWSVAAWGALFLTRRMRRNAGRSRGSSGSVPPRPPARGR